jgi:hypothetical protein
MRDGVVRYRDSNHLSVRYAASLADLLGKSLQVAPIRPSSATAP